MTQGKVKLTKGPAKVAKKSAAKKAGPKHLAPKKTQARKDAALSKKLSASLTSATEKLLASRVGHLELLKGTRRELEEKKRKEDSKGKSHKK